MGEFSLPKLFLLKFGQLFQGVKGAKVGPKV